MQADPGLAGPWQACCLDAGVAVHRHQGSEAGALAVDFTLERGCGRQGSRIENRTACARCSHSGTFPRDMEAARGKVSLRVPVNGGGCGSRLVPGTDEMEEHCVARPWV